MIGHEVEGENKKGETTFVIEARVVREMSLDKISNKIKAFVL